MRIKEFIVLLLISIPSLALAQEVQEDDTSPYSAAALVAEDEHIQPGVPFTLALKLSMDPGWHSYWRNPGDSGEPTDIEWDLPEDFSISPIQWPYPHRIDLGPLRSYGYEDEVLLLTELMAPSDLVPGTDLEIKAHAYWLICAEICLPAEEAIDITLPVRASTPSRGTGADAISSAQSNIPKPVAGWEFEATHYSESYVLQVTPPSDHQLILDGAYFFSSEYETIDHPSPQPITQEGDTYLMALQQSEYAASPAERLIGVLVAPEGANWPVPAIAIDAAVVPPEMAATQHSQSALSLPWMLLLAFAGGLLLNLMPCVFPVISIKILGFAQQGHQEEGIIRKQGAAFGIGVLLSFLILAGVFLGLRAAGNQIGWGFQLQSPAFVAGMALLFFGIGLNLLGVFEIGASAMQWGGSQAGSKQSGHVRRSLFDGALATLVATPCTAPFMGVALGAAIVLPPFQALLIFAFLGIGMALPYVILSMTPALVRRLPKPGSWMETLKHVLAFPMFATTLWLCWVFGRQTGVDGIAILLLSLLLLGLSLWIIGRWPAIQIPVHIRVITRTIAVVILLCSIGALYMGTTFKPATASSSSADESNWLPFATQQVSDLREAGQPVFIDFTAAWCLTCQVNKKTTLNNTAVQAAFRQKGVTLFQADWTNQDAEITQALEAHGRSGVPLYVLYAEGAEPKLLPEILTEQIVLAALETLPDIAIAQNQ